MVEIQQGLTSTESNLEAFNRGPADGSFAAITVELTAVRVCACAARVVCAGAECSRGCLEKNRVSHAEVWSVATKTRKLRGKTVAPWERFKCRALWSQTKNQENNVFFLKK